MSDAVLPVPVGSTLLHIGPHKTGTTALQHALRRGRQDLLAQGVRVAGPGAGEGDGVRLGLGLQPTGPWERAQAAWEQIVADLADTSVPRRVFSRETFANAGDRRARAVVEQLGGRDGGLHVAVSARPLAELIPSQYSQFVQRGLCTMPFEAWCEAVLASDAKTAEERSVRLFWKRHSHDVQVRRWGRLVGSDRVTVVVVDRTDPLFLARSFEHLLGLRVGTLSRRMTQDRSNRSLTVPELELVRQWHAITAETGADHGKIVRLAWRLCHQLRRFDPDPAAPRLILPAAAAERTAERGAAIAEAIAASGARVLGDLAPLARIPPAPPRPAPPVPT